MLTLLLSNAKMSNARTVDSNPAAVESNAATIVIATVVGLTLP
jgi:hypothetical protein